jgi:hypothetical protein
MAIVWQTGYSIERDLANINNISIGPDLVQYCNLSARQSPWNYVASAAFCLEEEILK